MHSDHTTWWKWAGIAGILLLLGGGLFNALVTSAVSFPGFVYDPPQWRIVPALETSWLYAILHLFTLLPVFVLSFDRKVHYYTSWRRLFPAIFLVAAGFIVWDIAFTHWKVWGFNEAYFSGWKILGLPWEEWLFFISVPFACLFIYKCLNVYVSRDLLGPYAGLITPLLILGLSGMGFYFFDRMYTATTCLLTAAFLLFHHLFLPGYYLGRFYLAYLVSWLPFLLVDGALTGTFTAEPVVLYNPEEFSGWRIISIPVEDSIYSLLMLLGVTTLYERWKKKEKKISGGRKPFR